MEQKTEYLLISCGSFPVSQHDKVLTVDNNRNNNDNYDGSGDT